MAWRWVIVWAALAAVYLFLAGDLGVVETTAALVCACIGTALAYGLDRVAHRRFAFIHPPASAIRRPLFALLPETAAVGRALLCQSFGRQRGQCGGFVQQPFDPGLDDDPTSASRRALAVLGLSLAPGSFVIRGDRLPPLVLHALPKRSPSRDDRWPA